MLDRLFSYAQVKLRHANVSDVIVFENLRFRPSAQRRRPPFSQTYTSVFDRISVDGRRKRTKKVCVFKRKRISVDGASGSTRDAKAPRRRGSLTELAISFASLTVPGTGYKKGTCQTSISFLISRAFQEITC